MNTMATVDQAVSFTLSPPHGALSDATMTRGETSGQWLLVIPDREERGVIIVYLTPESARVLEDYVRTVIR